MAPLPLTYRVTNEDASSTRPACGRFTITGADQFEFLSSSVTRTAEVMPCAGEIAAAALGELAWRRSLAS